jgi:hypothetical protein
MHNYISLILIKKNIDKFHNSWNNFCNYGKYILYPKIFPVPQIIYGESRNQSPQEVSGRTFGEQDGTGTESGDLRLDHRPCGKRGKMPPRYETEDHSRPGLEAFREGKNIRESEMKSFSPNSREAHDGREDLVVKQLKPHLLFT